MKIHEYQAKGILSRYGVPIPRGEVAFSAQEVGEIARRFGGGVVVVKAQIHAGGRGKGGGVKVVRSPDEAEDVAKDLLGKKLVTVQTGPEGQVVSRLLVEEGLAIDREFYLSIVIDRSSQKPVLMVSAEGGVDIEEVAAKTPEKIAKEFVEPAVGLAAFQARKLAFALNLAGRSGLEGGADDDEPLPGLHRHRRVAARSQPADRDQGRRPARARRQDARSTTTRFRGTRTSAICATSRKRIRSKSKPRSSR